MRLNQFLAACGVGSRRRVEPLILAGEIRINGRVVTELGYRVQPGDRVEHRGRVLAKPAASTVVLLNKPAGCLCTADDPQGRPTVFSLLRPEHRALHYIGRLDYESRGLLLFTDDGELSRRLTLPRYEVERVYRVRLDRPLARAELERARAGVTLDDGLELRPRAIEPRGPDWVVRLTEGKKREIRRLFEFVGPRVVDLQRESYGGLTLGTLREGASRVLTDAELQALRALVGLGTDVTEI